MKIAVIIPGPDSLDPELRKLVADGISGLLKSIEENGPKVERQYREGRLSTHAPGFDWYVDQGAKGGNL